MSLILVFGYLEIFNETMLWALLVTTLTLAFLTFLWLLKPLTKGITRSNIFKFSKYLHSYQLGKNLIILLTAAMNMYLLFFKWEKPPQTIYEVIFLVIRILLSIVFELYLFLLFFKIDAVNPLDRPYELKLK